MPSYADADAEMSTFDDVPPVPKVEQSEEDDFDESSGEEDIGNLAPDVPQVQKRKGGRKPVSLHFPIFIRDMPLIDC